MPTRNVSQVLWVAKAAANSGASVDTEPSISPASPGCTYCSMNIAPCCRVLIGAGSVGEDLFAQLVCEALMAGFGLGELEQKLPRRNVAAPSAALR